MFGSRLGDSVALNPQPLPPLGETGAFLWQAIRLHQYADHLNDSRGTTEVAQALFGSAKSFYDDGQCGSVPWQILLRWLGHPPPPPPPWLELVGHAVGNAMLGARMGGEFGQQLQTAASAQIHELLGNRSGSAAHGTQS